MDEALIKEFYKRLRERCARMWTGREATGYDDAGCIACGLTSFCEESALYRTGAKMRDAMYALFEDERDDVTDAMIMFNARLSRQCNSISGIHIACLPCGLRPFCRKTPCDLTDELIDAVLECLKRREAARNGEVR